MLLNEVPKNIKASKSALKSRKSAQNVAIMKGVYLSMQTINICPLTIH